MGVNQLETYIKKHVTKGYVEVSLIDECEKFTTEKEDRPILLIKRNGLLRPLNNNQEEIFCGIRHNVVNEKFEKLMGKLSEHADIKFFEESSICDAKLPQWVKEQNERYKMLKEIVSKIEQRLTLEDIISDSKELIASTSYLNFTDSLAQKYGDMTASIDRACSTEMVQFANQNSRVLAILDDDSDFLIYPGDWRYISLRDLDQETLKSMEYNKTALRDNLDLNDEELVILSTLNGNNVISYRYDAFYFHKSITENSKNAEHRFPAIAKFIKDNQWFGDINGNATKIAYQLYRGQVQNRSNMNDLVKKVQESIGFYDTKFEKPNITDEKQIFCREKSLNFVFMVLHFKPVTFALEFFDKKQPGNYFKCINDLFSKQVGIIHNYKSFGVYKIWSKMSFNDPKYSNVDIIKSLPRQELTIPLLQLLDRPNYLEHDHIRYKLLKWMISEEKLKFVDLQLIPKFVFLDALVLLFMVNERLVDSKVADIILLTLKDLNDGQVPENIQPPEILNPQAFYAAILFSKCHISIARCLEVTGLKEFQTIHNFDGVLFHNLFLQQETEKFDVVNRLGDWADYRYYAKA